MRAARATAVRPRARPPHSRATARRAVARAAAGAEGKTTVTEEVSYTDMIKALDKGQVARARFANDLSGRVLLIYKSGVCKVAQVPLDHTKTIQRMSRGGAEVSYLAPPSASGLNQAVVSAMSNVGPVVLLFGVWWLVHTYVQQKGDAEDRKKIRAKEIEEKKKLVDAAREDALRRTKEAAKAAAEKSAKEEAESAAKRTGAKTTAPAAGGRKKKGEEDDEPEDDPEQAAAKEFLSSSARVVQASKYQQYGKATTFDDVAGIGDAKVELEELVTFFTNPERFTDSGCVVPRGVLLCGPPGTGKTLAAKAVAGEAGVTFFYANASEFVEMFVGVGAARVRDLFAQARAAAPSIIFIDELDAVGKQRGTGGGSGNDERDATVNQLLTELDGFEGAITDANAVKNRVVIMAATNRPDILDSALMRAGRFDRKVFMGLPSFEGRRQILGVHAGGKPLGKDVLDDIASPNSSLAAKTPGFSGADIANLLNMAVLSATREGKEAANMRDCGEAIDLVQLGKRVKREQPLEVRRRLAAAEGARAVVAMASPLLGRVELVSIVPREGKRLGTTRLFVDEAVVRTGMWTHAAQKQMLSYELAGRAGEEAVFGDGQASSATREGVERARGLSQRMVLTGMRAEPLAGRRGALGWTLDDSYGAGESVQIDYLPGSSSKREADIAMHELLSDAYEESARLLEDNRPLLDAVVDELVTDGQLYADRLEELAAQHGLDVAKLPAASTGLAGIGQQ